MERRMAKTREEMERLRDAGLDLFHAALLGALKIGVRPHGGAVWHEIHAQFLKAAEYFAQAQTRGLPGGLTRNMRLEALALLEAASVSIDGGDWAWNEPAVRSRRLFEGVQDRLGVCAATVALCINERNLAHFELGFDLSAVLRAGAFAVPIEPVSKTMMAYTTSVASHPNRTSHVFPERDAVALAIYHSAVGFEPWRRVFLRCQREPIPHFELEIAAILVAYIVGVATAVTSDLVKDVIAKRRATKSASDDYVTRAELAEKLDYLLRGYRLRECHKLHPELIDTESFDAAWAEAQEDGRASLSSAAAVPSEQHAANGVTSDAVKLLDSVRAEVQGVLFPNDSDCDQ